MKNTFWMRTPEGALALVAGADERDRWIPHGLVAADEPQPGSGVFVWLEHDEHHGRAKFPVDVVEQYGALGWHPSPPPEPYDITKDPALRDVPPTPEAPAVEAEKSIKPAARRQNEE
jgi:hypothetical protein